MRFKLPAPVLIACLLAASGGLAHADQEVSVGRVDLLLPGEGWQAYSLSDPGRAISGGGYSHQQTSESKVLVRSGSNRVVDVLLIVRANSSGKGRFSGVSFSDATCLGGPGVYADGDLPGPAARSFRCMRVWAPLDLRATNGLQEDVKLLLNKEGLQLPPSMYAMLASQHANTGAFASVVAVMSPENLPAESDLVAGASSELPDGVQLASVQWGRQLQEAVSDSVYSIRGKLPIPALRKLHE